MRAWIIIFILMLLSIVLPAQTPIYNGVLQSDLNAAGFKILSANLSDYAGANMSWNVVTGKFDAVAPPAPVTSVFTRTGAVTAQGSDYAAFYESGLGNPGTSGFVLSSTTGGVRSWIAQTPAGAPTSTDYLVRTADGSLSAERVVTDTTSIIWDWATAGQSKATRAALTGDITAPANSNATTYANALPTGKGGLPTGGTTGQALTKINATDYNTQWTTLGGGTGTVTSITATAPIVVTPTPLTSTGVISLTSPLTATYMPAFTGDVTTTSGSVATVIGSNKVTLGMMATMATDSILGRATAATGNVEVLTSLPFAFTGDVTRPADSNVLTYNNALPTGKGGLPTGGTANQVLSKIDATNYNTQWVNPSGGGGTPGGSNTQVQFNNASAFGGITNATTDGTTMTLTSPKIVTDIKDTNANSVLGITATGSAVNYMTLANAASGNYPTIGIAGSGTDVGLIVAAKGGPLNAFSVKANASTGAAAAGRNTIVWDNTNATSKSSQFQWQNNANPLWSIVNDMATNGAQDMAFYDNVNSVSRLYLGTGGQFNLPHTSVLGWGAAGATITADTGLYRNAAGVVEINNGTVGTFRDLKARNIDLQSSGIITGSGTVPTGGTTGQVLKKNTNTNYDYAWAADLGGGAGSGDVVGPSSATDNAIARFDTTTGKLIQNSTLALWDNGALSPPAAGGQGVIIDWNLSAGGGEVDFKSTYDNGGGRNFTFYAPTGEMCFGINGGYGITAAYIGAAAYTGRSGVMLASSHFLDWNGDTSLSRNAAGVVEINNGTAGTLRDLTLRNLTISGTCTGCGGGGGGNVSNFGTPTVNQKAVWTDATHIQGVTDNALQWDGGSTSLVAATGRTSLGGTTVGQSFFTLTNPGAISFPEISAANAVSAVSASTLRTDIGAGNVNNTGTPANNQLGVWTAATTLEGDAGLTYDSSTTTLNMGGFVKLIKFDTNGGGWIDFPTTGSASGIGTGGAGSNPWVAYAFSNGQWVTEASAGDVVYRQTTNALLFSNSSSNAALAISGSQLELASGTMLKWSSTTSTKGTADLGIGRNAAGVMEVNNGTAGTFRDIKVDEVNAVTGYQVNGAAASNKVLKGNGTDFVASTETYAAPGTAGNMMVSDGTNWTSAPRAEVYSGGSGTGTGASCCTNTNTLIPGSVVTIPAGTWKANGWYHCTFDMLKTAAGSGTIAVNVHMGTLGTTSDAIIQTATFVAGTAAADPGLFDVFVNFKSVGSGTAAQIYTVARVFKNGTTTGLVNSGSIWATAGGALSSGFNSTTQTKMSLSFNGGPSFSGTNAFAQTEYMQ
jgi:hypothetical protein